MTEKPCTKCCEVKPLTEFHRNGNGYPYRSECKICRNEISRMYRQNNPEKMAASRRKWRQSNRDKSKSAGYQRKYLLANKEKVKAQKIKWRLDNYDKASKTDRQWKQANPEKIKAYKSRRRALKKGNGGSHTAEEWLALVDYYDNHCAYCMIEPYKHKDHWMPLARGGTDNIDNLVPSCASCNLRKSDKHPEVWMQEEGLL